MYASLYAFVFIQSCFARDFTSTREDWSDGLSVNLQI